MNTTQARAEDLFQASPNHSVIYIWLFNKLAAMVGILIFLFIFLGIQQFNGTRQAAAISELTQHAVFNHWYYILAAAVVVLVAFYFWFSSVIKAYSYKISDDCVELRYGLLGLNTRVIPLNQIVDINVRARFFEHQLGLASVYIDTVVGAMQANINNSNNTTRLEGMTLEDCDKIVSMIKQHLRDK